MVCRCLCLPQGSLTEPLLAVSRADAAECNAARCHHCLLAGTFSLWSGKSLGRTWYRDCVNKIQCDFLWNYWGIRMGRLLIIVMGILTRKQRSPGHAVGPPLTSSRSSFTPREYGFHQNRAVFTFRCYSQAVKMLVDNVPLQTLELHPRPSTPHG